MRLPITNFTYEDVTVRKRSGLPHWHTPNGLYFVTYRLRDSLPRAVEARLAVMKADLERRRLRSVDPDAARAMEREMFCIFETALDTNSGSCHMRSPAVAEEVLRALLRDDGALYRLLACTIMPNHVHVVFRLDEGELDDVLRRWKGRSAYEANQILGRTGPFWQADYFDVLIRNSRELHDTITYVLQNPSKAGLHEWAWVRSWPERIAMLC